MSNGPLLLPVHPSRYIESLGSSQRLRLVHLQYMSFIKKLFWIEEHLCKVSDLTISAPQEVILKSKSFIKIRTWVPHQGYSPVHLRYISYLRKPFLNQIQGRWPSSVTIVYPSTPLVHQFPQEILCEWIAPRYIQPVP